MPRLLSILTAALLFVGAAPAEPPDALLLKVYKSVTLLYVQGADGSMRMACTATAFHKIHGGYQFVSAAHCVGSDDTGKERAANGDDANFYVTFDEKGSKVFYPATLKAVGYQHKGDDFSIFDVKVDADWPTVPLGDESKEQVGNKVVNVASPLGLGKQAFQGSITNTAVDRPLISGDINWKGAMMLNIAIGPGSSGSAVVSVEQQAIIAFLVGTVDSNVIAVPVNRFKRFKDAVEAGKYPYFRGEDSPPPSSAEPQRPASVGSLHTE